jgi:hypothetical protein
LAHAEDPEHLTYAARHQLTLLTHDHDFVVLHQAWLIWPREWGVQPALQHGGIVLLSQAQHTALATTVIRFLAGAPPLADELFWLRSSAEWRRWRPGAGWRPYP